MLNFDEFIKVEYSDEGGVYREDGSYYDMDECDGFIPMPRYEPEKV